MNFLEINIFGKTGDPLVILLVSILGGVVLYNLFLVGCLFFTSVKIKKLKANRNYEDEVKLEKLQSKLVQQEEAIKKREEEFENHVDEWNSKEMELGTNEAKFEIENLKEKDWKKVEQYIEEHPEDWVNFALKINPKSRFWLGIKAQLEGKTVSQEIKLEKKSIPLTRDETDMQEQQLESDVVKTIPTPTIKKGWFKSRPQAETPFESTPVAQPDEQSPDPIPVVEEKRGWFGRRKQQQSLNTSQEVVTPPIQQQSSPSAQNISSNEQSFIASCENLTKEIDTNDNFHEDKMIFKQDFEVESDIYKKPLDDDLFVNMDDIIGAKEEEKKNKSQSTRFSLFKGRPDRIIPSVKKNIFTNASPKKFGNRKEQVEEDIKTLELELEK
ncbi:hypothetical protein ASO20_02870 [Mycoplasma sp. (ex Biomphalaria glabrata)]|uniref:hypothetical protein n=1 Tax=Mycoplasma sp. (ex Biomphalaria glabrata) TaxID=1749074 RepID=UPI00073AC5A8|nr:hypothetical protein [Mycoplasma sp. (ex Biomphalaria glabrata)]ALV23576.1 hypothetical protein ASO20_02870 [Mycoplasma sp. (ex Biomphalaria glabrata)]